MSYSEAMAKHYQDKRANKNVSRQPKYSNTCILAGDILAEGNLSKGATIYSKGKLDADTVAIVKEIENKGNYFIDSRIYSDEYMKSFNNKVANAKTVDELATYLGELDEEIEVLRLDNHAEKGLELNQWSSIDGIHLKTCFYI